MALALAGGIVLPIAGGDGDDDGSAAATTSPQTAQLQDMFLKQTVVEADKGISVRRPGNWSHTKRNGVISLQSRDSCLAMTLSAPQPAGQAKKLRSDSIDVFRSSYEGAQVQPAPSSQVGGIPTTSNTINVKDANGNPIRLLLGVGTGTKHAYLTEIVVRDPRCQGDLQLAQVVLGSIQYTK